MPNIATVFKGEVARLARKEVRAEVSRLQRASTAYRSEIAALKRRLATLERLMARVSKPGRATATEFDQSGERSEESSLKGRYSAKSMKSQRKRLGLSAAEMSQLLGTSAQSVYNWEEGKTRPQARYMDAIFGLRSLGRREVKKQLEVLAAAG